MSAAAAKLLMNQYKAIQREPLEGFFVSLNDDDLFHWRIWMEGPVDTPYHPGIYELSLTFPEDYPMNPPELHMVSDFFHPNVYPAGKVCISILHPPQHDELSGEHVSERWLPTRTPSSLLLSFLTLLHDPNCSSPANVDASVTYQHQRELFVRRTAELGIRSLRSLPSHVVIAHPESDEAERRRIAEKERMDRELREQTEKESERIEREVMEREADADAGDSGEEHLDGSSAPMVARGTRATAAEMPHHSDTTPTVHAESVHSDDGNGVAVHVAQADSDAASSLSTPSHAPPTPSLRPLSLVCIAVNHTCPNCAASVSFVRARTSPATLDAAQLGALVVWDACATVRAQLTSAEFKDKFYIFNHPAHPLVLSLLPLTVVSRVAAPPPLLLSLAPQLNLTLALAPHAALTAVPLRAAQEHAAPRSAKQAAASAAVAPGSGGSAVLYLARGVCDSVALGWHVATGGGGWRRGERARVGTWTVCVAAMAVGGERHGSSGAVGTFGGDRDGRRLARALTIGERGLSAMAVVAAGSGVASTLDASTAHEQQASRDPSASALSRLWTRRKEKRVNRERERAWRHYDDMVIEWDEAKANESDACERKAAMSSRANAAREKSDMDTCVMM